MNKYGVLRRMALAAGLALTATAVTATPALAGGPAHNDYVAEFEEKFLTETIDHHYLGVKMGELCVEKVTAPPPKSDWKLLDTCESIVETQWEQIEKMQKWLWKWYGVEKEPALPAGGQEMLDELAALNGEKFDRAISKEFIKHHKMFLPDAKECIHKAKHNKLEHLCETMYQEQKKEIGIFKWILKDHDKWSAKQHHRHGHHHSDHHHHSKHHHHDTHKH